MTAKKKKMHISIDKELVPKLEKECKEKKRTRSSLINYILNKYFDNQKQQ